MKAFQRTSTYQVIRLYNLPRKCLETLEETLCRIDPWIGAPASDLGQRPSIATANPMCKRSGCLKLGIKAAMVSIVSDEC